jgi:hypothetical protein
MLECDDPVDVRVWKSGRTVSGEVIMVLALFESASQRRKDDSELKALHKRFGSEIATVLEGRVADEKLSERDRKHWARLLRKARQRFTD